VVFIGSWIGYEIAGFVLDDSSFSVHLYSASSFVSKVGYASVFMWNKETGEYIKFGPTEIISVQG